jgi:hypothetical protein
MSILSRRNDSFVRAAAIVSLGLAACLPAVAQPAAPGQGSKPHRLIVLSDIGSETDDTESLVRLLLYSDVIDIQGLVATTSTHKRTYISPELMQAVIRGYSKVRPNLVKADGTYPTAETLQALVKRGLAEYGMKGVGAGKDSEGSEWIIRTLEKDDDRPLWVAAWGGPNTLAQALYKLRATKTAAELDRLVAKLRVYTISDQDDSGPWMRKTFPALFYIVSPGGYAAGTWTGINQVVPGIDNSTISNKWLTENIQQGHGALGAEYPDVAYGMEGDTPSFLALIPNGLSDPEHPDWGGWGGRYELYRPELAGMDPHGFTGGVPIDPETRPIWTNAIDQYTPPERAGYGRATRPSANSVRDFKATIWRWRDDFQNDFAARMDWTTKSEESNHPPVPVLDHSDAITVRSGQNFSLGAHATDPDGDSVSFFWFQYPEAGSYRGVVTFLGAENMAWADLVAPKVDKPETVHFILRVTDKGRPPLSRYKRVIVTITP